MKPFKDNYDEFFQKEFCILPGSNAILNVSTGSHWTAVVIARHRLLAKDTYHDYNDASNLPCIFVLDSAPKYSDHSDIVLITRQLLVLISVLQSRDTDFAALNKDDITLHKEYCSIIAENSNHAFFDEKKFPFFVVDFYEQPNGHECGYAAMLLIKSLFCSDTLPNTSSKDINERLFSECRERVGDMTGRVDLLRTKLYDKAISLDKAASMDVVNESELEPLQNPQVDTGVAKSKRQRTSSSYILYLKNICLDNNLTLTPSNSGTFAKLAKLLRENKLSYLDEQTFLTSNRNSDKSTSS